MDTIWESHSQEWNRISFLGEIKWIFDNIENDRGEAAQMVTNPGLCQEGSYRDETYGIIYYKYFLYR